jgi:sortase A
VGIAMSLFAVAVAAVVAVVVNLSGTHGAHRARTGPVGRDYGSARPGGARGAGAAGRFRRLATALAGGDRPPPEMPLLRAAAGRGPDPDGRRDRALRRPVIDGASEAALEQGVIHLPQTPMPWDERAQKNVYLAGHRLGFPSTRQPPRLLHLDKLRRATRWS